MKNKPVTTLSLSKGYTLVELVIVMSLIAILVGFGLSSYGKARDRQMGQVAAESVMNLLRTNQQSASTGKKDCVNAFLGQKVVIAGSGNTITSQSLCQGDVGAIVTTTVPNVTFQTGATITFLPLSGGVDLGGSTNLQINFTSTTNIKYAITMNNAGSLQYLGIQP